MNEARATPASVGNLLKRAVRLFRQRAFVNAALGAAVVLSLIAVCCGIGALSAPWFLAELTAVQLAELRGSRLERTRGWFAAMGVLLAAVLLVGCSAWLTTLAFETQVQADGPFLLDRGFARPGGLAIAAVTTVLALATVVPLFYVPVILLDRGGNVGGALLESVRLVVEGGFLRHLVISLSSHVVQLAPLLVASGIGMATRGPAAIPTALLIAAPVLTITLPIGQGMFVAAYADMRDHITNPRRTRSAGRPPRALVLAMLACILAPVASLLTFGASLIRPSHVAVGEAGPGPVVGEIDLRRQSEGTLYPPDTTLEVRVTPKRVRVVAGDGGGAGTLRLRGKAPIDRVRVVRQADVFAIEIERAGQHLTTRVDATGVRQDDDLNARLSDRAPLWAIVFMLGTLLLGLALFGPPVHELAMVRRLYTLSGMERPDTATIHQRRARAVRRGWLACAALTPAIGATLYWAVRAALGL